MFTLEQINEIRQKLAYYGIKDSQFNIASSVNEEDTIVIVQGGVNKNVPVGMFYENIVDMIEGGENNPSRLDMFNVSRYSAMQAGVTNSVIHTLQSAINDCPNTVRYGGTLITFVDSNSTWNVYQYKDGNSTNWDNTSYWIKIFPTEENDPIFTASPANNLTQGDLDKLTGIEDNAQVNVQSDWEETDVNSDAFIQNKPNLDSLIPIVTLEDVPLDYGGEYILGSINGVDYKISMPDAPDSFKSSKLILTQDNVQIGEYDPSNTTDETIDITMPNIPADISYFNNDTGYITSSDLPDLSDYVKNSDITLYDHVTLRWGESHLLTQVGNSKFTTVIMPTVPSYVEIVDAPTALSEFTNDTSFTTTADLAAKANTADLSKVAFTGSYSSLSDAPALQTITQTAYDALAGEGAIDEGTLYFIIEEEFIPEPV